MFETLLRVEQMSANVCFAYNILPPKCKQPANKKLNHLLLFIRFCLPDAKNLLLVFLSVNKIFELFSLD